MHQETMLGERRKRYEFSSCLRMQLKGCRHIRLINKSD
ncbi:MAG: hypothetical protein JWR60_2452, partial [Polaromonas sp.]|nr:hypothetical protein [Polaromonas sp.]